jgi:hypothetical protein
MTSRLGTGISLTFMSFIHSSRQYSKKHLILAFQYSGEIDYAAYVHHRSSIARFMVIFKLKSHAMSSQDWFVVGTLPTGHRVPIASPLSLRVAKTGKNHLNEETTALLPTARGYASDFSQTVTIWDMQRSCADVNSPYKRSAELTQWAL